MHRTSDDLPDCRTPVQHKPHHPDAAAAAGDAAAVTKACLPAVKSSLPLPVLQPTRSQLLLAKLLHPSCCRCCCYNLLLL